MMWSANRIVSSSCSTTTSVLPRSRNVPERIKQARIVSRMQSDGRLVENIEDALQFRTKLRGEPDALRFTAGKGRGRAVERQIAQANLDEKFETLDNLRQNIARDAGFTALGLDRTEKTGPPRRWRAHRSGRPCSRHVFLRLRPSGRRTARASGFSRWPLTLRANRQRALVLGPFAGPLDFDFTLRFRLALRFRTFKAACRSPGTSGHQPCAEN